MELKRESITGTRNGQSKSYGRRTTTTIAKLGTPTIGASHDAVHGETIALTFAHQPVSDKRSEGYRIQMTREELIAVHKELQHFVDRPEWWKEIL